MKQYFANPYHYFHSLPECLQNKLRQHYKKYDLDCYEVPVEVLQERVQKMEVAQ